MKRSKYLNLISFASLMIILCIPARDLQTTETFINQSPQFAVAQKESVSDSLAWANRYLALLDEADDSTFRRDFEADFLLILNPKQKAYYADLPTLLDRKEFIANYWSAYNPDPLLPENDRLLDHILRVAHARKNFPSRHYPFVDDRGVYYIRYGKPVIRYTDPGGIRRVAFFSPGIYNRILRFYTFKGGPQKMYSVPPNETWSYENVTRDYVVHFVWKGREYGEVKSLSEILPTQRKAHMAWQWSDLIKKRASVSPALSRAAAEIELFESELISNMSMEIATGTRLSKGTAHVKMIETLQLGEKEIIEARKHVPGLTYDPVRARNTLRFYDTVSQFRGEKGTTRIDIQMYVPIRKNFLAALDTSGTDTFAVEMGAMLRDSYFQLLDQRRKKRRASGASLARNNLPYFVEQLSFSLPPQKTELTLQVRDLNAKALGFSKRILRVKNYPANALVMSDILLLSPLQSPAQRALLPVVKIQGMELVPYPEPEIRKSRPLFCYFEIYNLKTSGISETIEIAYRLSTGDQRAGFFKKFTQLLSRPDKTSVSLAYSQPISKDSSAELIAVDLSQVAGGRHILEISVSDPETPEVRTAVKRRITIRE